jgi:hypothetical protein
LRMAIRAGCPSALHIRAMASVSVLFFWGRGRTPAAVSLYISSPYRSSTINDERGSVKREMTLNNESWQVKKRYV